jgi:uncharacterized protein (DUF2336 family)
MPNADAPTDLISAAALQLTLDQRLEARGVIVGRLIDLVSWPSSRIPAFERQLAADILVGLIRSSGADLRARCANGLAGIVDAPKNLLRYLARDDIQVSRTLLEAGLGFDDSDLVATIRAGVSAHWNAIAKRKQVSEVVADALLQTNDTSAVEALLINPGARLSAVGVDLAVARSRSVPGLIAPLLQRPELRPSQALVLFWWSDAPARAQILRRFAVERSVLIAELSGIFALAAQEAWADAESRKALQLIERRQRNRSAAERSPYGSLEGAIAAAAQAVDEATMLEIAHLCGVKPATARQIFSDPGGEPIAVLAKATGLKRPALGQLWRALGRPVTDAERLDTPYGRTMQAYESLSAAKAQTVLRYWNWSFTADAGAPAHEPDAFDEFSTARRNAALLARV